MSSLLAAPCVGEIVELRRARRFQLSAPAFFCWTDQGGALQERSGTTRDICMAGAFIVAETVPPAGARVGVDIYLPAEISGKGLELHGEGKVVRVENAGQSASGFAADVVFQVQQSGSPEMDPHETQ
jgi:PilZ domain